MTQIQLKICGLQPDDDLSFTSEPAVTHVGFVFVPASKRYVSPQQAAAMIAGLDQTCCPVGVFVDASVDHVLSICASSGVKIAQLHGQEDPATCTLLRQAGVHVWKSISVPTHGIDVSYIVAEIARYANHVDGILLDAKPAQVDHPTLTGGHGAKFPWRILSALNGLQAVFATTPIWIAGGLTPENVHQLFDCYVPSGVDISSGVEMTGRKSLARIQSMIEEVARYGTARIVS